MNGLTLPLRYSAIILAFCLIIWCNTSPALAESHPIPEEAKLIERLYTAAFDRPPLSDGLDFWIDSFESGQSIDSIAEKFISSPEFVEKYGSLNNTDFVRQLFRNVLGREGAPSGVQAWTHKLASGTSRATVLREFAESKENRRKYQNPAPGSVELAVSSIRDIGTIRVNPMILRRDAGFSALYRGRSIWVFGDTVLETPDADNKRMISSSLSSTFDIDAGDGIDGLSERVDAVGAPATFFPFTEEEKALNRRDPGDPCTDGPCTARWHIWPGTIVVDDEKDWAYVFYRKVLAESGLYKFQHVGHSIAVWKDMSRAPERPVFNHVESYPTLFWSEDEPAFDSAAVVLNSEAYVYGCELDENSLTKPCHLARVTLANILDKSAWSYYSGNGNWSSDILHAEEIFNGNDMMSVFFSPYIHRFVAIYSAPLGAKAIVRTAPHPEGPWSEPMELFAVEAPKNAFGWVYDFLAHPELSQDGGRTIYITYSKGIDNEHTQLKLVAVEIETPR